SLATTQGPRRPTLSPYTTLFRSHRGPGTADHQEAALAGLDRIARFVDDGGVDAGQRHGARTRLERMHAGQRRDHVAAGLGLPPGIDHRAAAPADFLVVQEPGFRIDR